MVWDRPEGRSWWVDLLILIFLLLIGARQVMIEYQLLEIWRWLLDR